MVPNLKSSSHLTVTGCVQNEITMKGFFTNHWTTLFCFLAILLSKIRWNNFVIDSFDLNFQKDIAQGCLMLSRAIWALFFLGILIQNGIKKPQSRSNFRGVRTCCAPPLDPPLLFKLLFFNRRWLVFIIISYQIPNAYPCVSVGGRNENLYVLSSKLFISRCVISSVESQKGAINIHWCSVENQKGGIAACTKSWYGDTALLVLNGTSLNTDSALLALNWRHDSDLNA